ncbi:rap gtpase-activating protein [Anaeramoeba ignava]|uniref:Rap gtpase-activating protein n=1 Tax=Anaeramoeba ignava TaxID=1746090 RepID=A0A9Q0LA46_ANAIG|nr:rap gtpase-activating protein [Anaeramoeba ignava]
MNDKKILNSRKQKRKQINDTQYKFDDDEFIQVIGYQDNIQNDSLDIEIVKEHKKNNYKFLFLKGSQNWIIEEVFCNEKKKLKPISNEKTFTNHFSGKEYYHFVSKHPQKGYTSICIQETTEEKEKEQEQENKEEIYKIFVLYKENHEFHVVKKNDLNVSFFRNLFCMGPSISKVIETFDSSFKNVEIFTCNQNDQEDEKSLVSIEKSKSIYQFKFGVVYVKDGQTTEEEILSNNKGSREFNEFLQILGEKVELFHFDHYRGGLDTKHNFSGKYSFFTTWNEMEIMFHVSTLIPTSTTEINNPQIEKKRHIGNDIVVILFLDGKDLFNPETFISKQNHVLIAVRPLKNLNLKERNYIIQTARKESVPEFEPYFPDPPIIPKRDLRDYLLAKACFGERTTTNSGVFKDRFKNYVESTLKSLYEKYQKI